MIALSAIGTLALGAAHLSTRSNLIDGASTSAVSESATEAPATAYSDAVLRSAFQDVIARYLKSPSSAEFGPPEEWIINRIEDGHIEAIGWVDAQNVFGAQLRSYFAAEIDIIDANRFFLTYLIFDGDKEAVIGRPHSNSLLVRLEKAQRDAELAERDAAIQKRMQTAAAAQRAAAEAERRKLAQRAAFAADEERRARAFAARRAEIIAREEQRQAELKAAADADLQRQLKADEAAPMSTFRVWSSHNGKYTTYAQIISATATAVQLEKRSGKRIEVPIDRLDEADRVFLEQWRGRL